MKARYFSQGRGGKGDAKAMRKERPSSRERRRNEKPSNLPEPIKGRKIKEPEQSSDPFWKGRKKKGD